MNPFSTSLHSTFNVGRSKFNVLSLFLLTVTIAPAQPNRDEQDSEVVIVPGGHSILRWYGHPNRSYFIQVSDQNDPLGKWNWAPLIEAGNGAEISHQIGGIADNAFFRLRYTGLTPGPGETLDTADFDGDGLSNIDEIKPPFPITATDPLDPESDKDGLPDGWERSFAAGMLALGAPPGHWGANGAALQSGNLDPNATLQDDGMTIREIYNSTTTPDDYQMILHDLFIQAKRAEFSFGVSHESTTYDDGSPTTNQGGGDFTEGSAGFGGGTIETWCRTSPSFNQLDVQLDPFAVTPNTSLTWFNNESQYARWTYHTHWVQAFDPEPRTLFPIEEMDQSSYTFRLTDGGGSQYYQFQGNGPVTFGQSATKTYWRGETRKSKFRLYRPRPTNGPVNQNFLKVTTERPLAMIGDDPYHLGWSAAPPTPTVEWVTATIPAFGHTSPWIETTPQAAAQRSRTVDLLPVEVVELSPKTKDENGNDIADSEKPSVGTPLTPFVEVDPATNKIAHRELKVRIGEALKGKTVTWTMEPGFIPNYSPTGPNLPPVFRGNWTTAAASHRNRFEASTAYGANGFTSLSQASGRTTVGDDGFTAIRVNIPPVGYNVAKIKIQIEGTASPIDLIDIEVPAIVVIDPGHGGTTNEPGSSANNATSPTGVKEKDLALTYGLALRDTLKAKVQQDKLNTKILMTRDTDVNVAGTDRAHFARDKGTDVVFVIHFNASASPHSARGTLEVRQLPSQVNLDEDVNLINPIIDSVVAAITPFDAGANKRSFVATDTSVAFDPKLENTETYHPIRVGYCEVEFLDNAQVDVLLNTGSNASAVKTAIVNAMRDGILS